jgi:primosomal protein N' (replication factor Y) (superfamily II helicase)
MDAGQKYAEVFVDIRSMNVDHPFDYIIPETMAFRITTGSVVMVPVQNRVQAGEVAAVKDSTSVAGPLKEIKGLVDIPPVFDTDRIELASWISSYYVQPLTTVMSLFLPPGRKNKKSLEGPGTSHKYETMVSTGKVPYDSSAPEWKRQKAQKRIMEALAERGGMMEKKSLLAASGSGNRALKSLAQRQMVILGEKRVMRDFRYETAGPGRDIVLNRYQEECIKSIGEKLFSSHKFLIRGVTGSGKTEIYMNICSQVLSRGRKALVLVPEISLTPQLYARFENMFGDRVAVYHSHMSPGERYDRWMEILKGNVGVVIGTRSALFTPLKDPGIIIMDEEHDPSYKENSLVRYNTRDVASKFSEIMDIPLVMGSATPSIETRHMAGIRKDYTLLTVPVKAQNTRRVKRSVVDLKKTDRTKGSRLISGELYRAAREELDKNNKVIIFINRRGFSNFVVCSACGSIPVCPACELSYNYHRDISRLVCHHCGREEAYTGTCGVCGSQGLFLAGSGIQRVEAGIRKMFSGTPVYRMDSDITSRKKSHQTIINSFSAPGKAILVGTQMVAKGLDIPDVTLVGIINCDGMLSLPDYHMNERAYQLITQVSGRAGRKDKEGRVVIQTYRPESGLIRHSMDEDYESFYAQELAARKELSYPPFTSLANIVISGLDEKAVAGEAKKILDKIKRDIKMNIEILGPAPAPFYRINRYWRRHILLKTREIEKLTGLLGESLKSYRKNKDIRLIIDVDPAWIL